MKPNSRTAHKCLQVSGALTLLAFIAIALLLQANFRQQRRARTLLQTLRRFELGKTPSADAVKLVRNLNYDTAVSAWIDEPKGPRMGSDRLDECQAAPCTIEIVLLLPGQYVGSDWFPRNNAVLSHYIPQKMVLARISVRNGLVTRVSALLESHDGKPSYEAGSVMYSSEGTMDPTGIPRWKIEAASRHYAGGYWGGNYNSLNVHADEFVPFDQVSRAFEFNPKCLGLWAHCSACEILKACAPGSRPSFGR